jgi:signal recognition particle subunit SRP54
MFDRLTESISNSFSKLRGKGLLREDDINEAMREIRIALLEADVALPVAKEFIEKVKAKALGEEVTKSISPAQMVVKIVHDELTEILGGENINDINLNANPPVVVLVAGLQGSGKTTSCGKLANYLKNKKNKKVLLASLDIYRPAAQQQLEILAKQVGVESLEIIAKHKPKEITERALKKARTEGFDVVILDTAGRLHVDEELMKELKDIERISNPTETFLVADSLTGQDAVNIAKEFSSQVKLTGVILTRMDADARGGAALSMRQVTGCPIKFVGVGEKISEFEAFDAKRVAGRILDMGDIVAMVEKAQENFDQDEAEKMMKKMQKGGFDLDDMHKQIKMIEKMGGVSSIAGMLPGLGKMKSKIEDANLDQKVLKKQLAIIESMTRQEKRFPKVLNGSRKRRIAKGSGTTVQEVNMLIKQHMQMSKMMGKLKGFNPAKMGNMAAMKNLFNGM